MSLTLDHIAVVCADLKTGTDWLSEKLGVPLHNGGKHVRFGTHNNLLGLADGLYLEVIAPDRAACIDGSCWFGLDQAPVSPQWGNWICRADNLTAMRDLTGPVVSMARGDLKWQITVPDDGSLPMGGGFPTLIKWADNTPHPAIHLPDSKCKLVQWEVLHPNADDLRWMCRVKDARVVFNVAETIGFRAIFDTPSGRKFVS